MSMKRLPYITILILTTALWLAACTDHDEPQGVTGEEQEITLVSATRGITPLEQQTDVPTIQVYLYATDGSVTPGVFSYYSDAWHGNFGVKVQQYYIYGFAPASAAQSCVITSDDYSQGATMTLTGLSAVTADDICVLVGVQQVDNNTVGPDIRDGVFWYQGQFGFTGRSKDENQNNQNFACLMLDHIFAGIDFELKVAEEYDELRTIKLKKMELGMMGGESVNITLKLQANNTQETPITEVTENVNNGTQTTVLFEDEEGKALSTDVYSIPGCFWPSLDKQLTLTTTYDVYDKKGTRVREDCTATNNIDIGTLRDTTTGEIIKTGRGTQAVVSLTIRPTYLYQLSEPELDNPSVSVEN